MNASCDSYSDGIRKARTSIGPPDMSPATFFGYGTMATVFCSAQKSEQ
jgi:hypothetical protein